MTTEQQPGVLEGVAQARLEVSYGMSGTGARRLLADALMNGTAHTATLHVTCTDQYPPTFEVTDLLASK